MGYILGYILGDILGYILGDILGYILGDIGAATQRKPQRQRSVANSLRNTPANSN